jgi:tetratricopeptide (TPR) repeat protein
MIAAFNSFKRWFSASEIMDRVRNVLCGLAFVAAAALSATPYTLSDVRSTCGIAAGEKIEARDIEIRCGLSFDQIKELFKSDSAAVTALVEVSKKLGFKEQAIKGFLETIKREQVPDEKLAETFATIARDYLSLVNERQAITTGGAEAQELLKQADAAIDAGQIGEAKAHLNKVIALREEQRKKREALREELDKADLEDAAVISRSAKASLTQLEYLTAAKLFEQAAGKVPAAHWQERGNYLLQAANALQTLGDQKGDNEALKQAITAYRRTLSEYIRTHVPLDWAMTQTNLGNALRTVGERESGTARLEEAVTAYRLALEEQTRERVPLDWAMTQSNLGKALRRLGERESGTARLEEAVTAYRLALEEQTRERVPLRCAVTQNNLGLALQRLGESGAAGLEEAVVAYRAALEEYTRERTPLDWAATQNDLGTALSRLGERESGTAKLEEAVTAYRLALEEQTRQRVPLDWAMTQANLGLALGIIGERKRSRDFLVEAKKAVELSEAVYIEVGQTQYANDCAKLRRQIDAVLAEM